MITKINTKTLKIIGIVVAAIVLIIAIFLIFEKRLHFANPSQVIQDSIIKVNKDNNDIIKKYEDSLKNSKKIDSSKYNDVYNNYVQARLELDQERLKTRILIDKNKELKNNLDTAGQIANYDKVVEQALVEDEYIQALLVSNDSLVNESKKKAVTDSINIDKYVGFLRKKDEIINQMSLNYRNQTEVFNKSVKSARVKQLEVKGLAIALLVATTAFLTKK